MTFAINHLDDVWYNEIDPFAVAWLRALISAGHIAPGDVDTRSIVDVRPDDLRSYTQCHFFAGIGVWSYALRRAGWSDDRPVWTGSCPCQPFSAAGKGGGFDDERHLWPHFHYLIAECRPPVVAGEQVASKDGLGWLDLVQADLEGTDYAFGAIDTCSAGFGAPHIRQRLWWLGERLANAGLPATERQRPDGGQILRLSEPERFGLGSDTTSRLADPDDDRFQGRAFETLRGEGRRHEGNEVGRSGAPLVVGMADASVSRRGQEGQHECGSPSLPTRLTEHGGVVRRGGPANGFWRDPDWLFCRDAKWRPVEPGTFPLAHGAPARVGRLRGYGNAINAEAATSFIEAYLETKAIDTDRHIRLTALSDFTTNTDQQEDIFG